MPDNPSITIDANKTKRRTTFKIKPEYYLELFTPGMMELLGGSKKRKIEIETVKMYPI